MAIMVDVGREQRDAVRAGADGCNVAHEGCSVEACKVWRCASIAVSKRVWMSKCSAEPARRPPMHLLPDIPIRRLHGTSRDWLIWSVRAALSLQPRRAKTE